ncbi:MAG: HAMP domain-containing histidine kinase [Clostridiales bacterium]|nr:HAMP domain-containing histidine kinase [Clostridiales bacterium]
MKKRKRGFTLRLFFTIVILIEFTIVLLVSNGLIVLIDHFLGLPVEIPLALWVVILSMVLGTTINAIFSKQFLSPITRLSRAMSNVAEGDFSTRLEITNPITELRETYDHFNIMTQELASTEVLQTDFVSNVSHEFKTPINAIEGYAMLLQGDPNISKEQAEYTEKILFNTKRLSDLVGNILLLSKIENQTIQTKKEVFRLDEQIRQAIVMLEPKWTERETEFDVNMEKVSYRGNEGLLLHVWVNLIGNAIKFGPPNGTVQIRLKSLDHSISFMVQDEGTGIDEALQKRVFDKFYQTDSSHEGEGNGLGLALAKRIVDINQGSIGVQNMAEGGCRFTVVLPLES